MSELLGFANKEILQRNKAIAIEILSGETFTKVGAEFDLTRERVRQIFQLVIARIDAKASEKYTCGTGYFRVAKARQDSAELIRRINEA